MPCAPLTALAAAALALAACIPLPRGYDVSSRRVAGKRDGDTLVTDDGSWCRVSQKAYEEAEAGRDHVCVWKNASDRPAGTARGIPRR